MEILKLLVLLIGFIVIVGSGFLGCYLDLNNKLNPAQAWSLGVISGIVGTVLMALSFKINL